GEDNGIVLPLVEFPYPRVHVPPQVFNCQIRIVAQELGPAPCARSPDNGYCRDRAGISEEIGRGIAGEDRRGNNARGSYRRDILHAVHRTVDLVIEDGVIERPDKDSLLADLMERDAGDLVALRADDRLFDID